MTITEIQKTRGIKLPETNLGYLNKNDIFYLGGTMYTVNEIFSPMVEVYGKGRTWAFPMWLKVRL